jgi:hypothetical protein
MEEFDIIKKELVVISGEKMAFQQETYDSIAKTERATSLMHVELREACDSIAETVVRLSELLPEIKKTDGTITSVKKMVAVTNFRVKDLQNNMSKLVKRSPVMILF